MRKWSWSETMFYFVSACILYQEYTCIRNDFSSCKPRATCISSFPILIIRTKYPSRRYSIIKLSSFDTLRLPNHSAIGRLGPEYKLVRLCKFHKERVGTSHEPVLHWHAWKKECQGKVRFFGNVGEIHREAGKRHYGYTVQTRCVRDSPDQRLITWNHMSRNSNAYNHLLRLRAAHLQHYVEFRYYAHSRKQLAWR